MDIKKYVRRTFPVDAIQVTAENIEEVATWCTGDVRKAKRRGTADPRFIKVRVYRPIDERQTEAYIGDWVLYAGTGYKVYTDAAFQKSFELSEEEAD